MMNRVLFSVFLFFTSSPSYSAQYTPGDDIIMLTPLYEVEEPPTSAQITQKLFENQASDITEQIIFLNKEFKSSTVENCKDCSLLNHSLPLGQVRTKNPIYESCHTRNSYLEKELGNLKPQSLMGELRHQNPADGVEIIDGACSIEVMKSVFSGRSGVFRACAPGQKNITQRVQRACLSPNYAGLMKNTFDFVGTCLSEYLTQENDLDSSIRSSSQKNIRNQRLLTFFSLLGVESGFHINAMSFSGSTGVGQLTSGAISYLNGSPMDRVRAHLKNSPHKACQRMANEILNKQMAPERSRSCERISIQDGNPLKNMVYSLAYVRANKEILNSAYFSGRDKAKLNGLPASEKDRLLTALAMWAHNTGSGGLGAPLNALLNSKYRNKPITNVDEFLLKELAPIVGSPAFSSGETSARRNEKTKYFEKINNLNRDLGASCLK